MHETWYMFALDKDYVCVRSKKEFDEKFGIYYEIYFSLVDTFLNNLSKM